MKDLMKKLMKHEESDMSEHEKMAKMDALKELIKEMSMLMSSDLSDDSDETEMQKVTVAAPDSDSLVEGLSKAESMVKDMPESLHTKGIPDDEDMF